MNSIPIKDVSCCALDARQAAARFAALAHPARIEILRHLSARSSCCCGDVVGRLDLAQSTVSQHLKILVEAGLVRFAAEGKRSRYAVDGEALAALAEAVAELARTCRPADKHK